MSICLIFNIFLSDLSITSVHSFGPLDSLSLFCQIRNGWKPGVDAAQHAKSLDSIARFTELIAWHKLRVLGEDDVNDDDFV